MEEISRVLPRRRPARSRFPSGLVGNSILRYGTEEQKQRYLRRSPAARRSRGAGVTEARSGTDVSDMDTHVPRATATTT